MGDERQINPRHEEIRAILRIVGPAVAVVGFIFTAVGIGSFFSSFGSFDASPSHFWCTFIGLPMLGVGIAISKFAFMGAIGRYVAGEVAPVAKDTFNYMAGGAKDGVRDIAQAVSEGLREAGGGATSATVVRCHKCNEENQAGAKFCAHCGAALLKTKECPSCRELNDPDAKFCDNCGREIG